MSGDVCCMGGLTVSMIATRSATDMTADIFAAGFRPEPYWWDDVPREDTVGLPAAALRPRPAPSLKPAELPAPQLRQGM